MPSRVVSDSLPRAHSGACPASHDLLLAISNARVASRIAVAEGERVTKGQHIGNVGATGRATGPHLHWSLKWYDARLDPLLFTGPMD